ncbi:MAG: hypothetical protein EHM33_32825 [Chloroflexi bacterium]|nr:MAG: hypothetical protein EHM33_32825 [Chloroflexota bacterium]
MQPFVQSAIDAANRGENNKALELLKQALAANPNDVEAWLVVAAVVEQPERKRQCLNRVLTLDPINQIARDELLEMDRAAMGGMPPSAPEPAYQPAASPLNYPTSTSAFESASAPQRSAPDPLQAQAKAAPKPSPKTRTEKPLVFKYPLFWRILMYLFLAFFGCAGLLVASQNIVNSLPFLGLALAMVLTIMAFSPKVEITEMGIRASGMLSSSEAHWNEIKSMKSGGMKQRLELLKSSGEVVKVSTQVSGYPRIVEILRQKRPDLFGMAAAASPSGQGNMYTAGGYEQTSSGSYGSSVAAAAFSGTKNFEKSFFRKYGSYILIIPLCLISVWAVFAEPENRMGALLLAAVSIAMMILPLFQVSGIKVEPNQMTIETLFEQKVLSARQIREIKMQSVRGRQGRATNFVVIIPTEGKKYSLADFADGDEIIYGFLTNWWNAYRNR